MNTIIILGLIAIILLSLGIYSIIRVVRSKKELIWKVLLFLTILLIAYYTIGTIVVLIIAKLRGVLQ